MRVSGLLAFSAVMICFNPLICGAQTEPFHKHHDSRNGHDHYYPDRGAIVRDLPVGAIGTSYGGVSYRYHDGIWLEPRGPAYMVVAPPIGLVAPTLPLYSTVVAHGADSFLYCNDTYYRPRPDLGGYEVVNDPTLESGAGPAPAADALVGGAMPSAPTPVPVAAVAPSAAPVGAPTAAVPVMARESNLAGGVVPTAPAMPGAVGVPAAMPAAGIVPAAAVAAPGTQKVPKVFLYPKNGQSADQQARDRYDCYRFAVAQSGVDPMRTTGTPPAPTPEQQSDYDRAQGACFEGRGYSNR